MHPYFFSLLYRERLAQFEREAEIRRLLPKRERRSLKRFASLLPHARRRALLVAPATAEACTCR